MKTTLNIHNGTRSTIPTFPFAKVAELVLPGWEVSLAFVGEKRAKDLNISLRKKTYTPNVLTYVAGKKFGEIIICPSVAKKQAKEYELSYPDMLGFLFIHGTLHLKGGVHGATMDRKEREILSRFQSIPRNAKKNRRRN